MLSAYVQAATGKSTTVAATNLPEFHALDETHGDLIALDAIEMALEEAEECSDRLAGIFASVDALGANCGPAEAKLVHGLLNHTLEPLNVAVSFESIFIEDSEGGYEVSMEAFGITFKELWEFIKAATRILVDAAKRYFGRRLTFAGRAYQNAVAAKEKYASLILTNGHELVDIQHDFASASKYAIVADGDAHSLVGVASAKAEMTTLSSTLDPQAYRTSIETLISVLASYKGVDDADLVQSFNISRKMVINAVREYLHTGLKTNEGFNETERSPLATGHQSFVMTYRSERDSYAPSVNQEYKASKSAPYKGKPITPAEAAQYAEIAEMGLDAVIKLRQDYADVRRFKGKADDAVKSTREMIKAGGISKEVEHIYRSIPSYVNLYNKALKLKSDMVYNYCIGLLAILKGSQQYWKVRVAE